MQQRFQVIQVEHQRGLAWLIQERGISFDRIIALIEGGKLIQVLEHPDKERYPDQLLYEVDVDGYVYVVPVVREGHRAQTRELNEPRHG